MTPFKATVFLAVGLCMVGSLSAQEKAQEEDTIRVYKRVIPADVLRGMAHFSPAFFATTSAQVAGRGREGGGSKLQLVASFPLKCQSVLV